MRYTLLVFLFWTAVAKGQFLGWVPDTQKIIRHLVEPSDTLVANRNAPLEIHDYSSLSKYLKPQSRHLPLHFDFSKQYIRLNYICYQCVTVCHHSGQLYEPCHRNRCSYTPYWAIQNRTHTHPVPYEKVFIKGFSPYLQENHRQDTLIVYEKNLDTPLPENGPEYIFLHAILGGDCHAHFTHELFQDDEKKTVTWIVHNHYGGCRAGYSEPVYFRIKNPGAGYTFVFNEVLESKW